MSHFTTLVIGDNPEEMLAPYNENLDVEPYRDYEDGNPADYWTIRVLRGDLAGWQRIHADGEDTVRDELLAKFQIKHREWDRQTPAEKTDREISGYHLAGKHADLINEDPMTWATVAHLTAAYSPDETPIHVDEEGRGYTMSTRNPLSKWDWYSLGGRWTGFFLPKRCTTGKVGQPGAFGHLAKVGWVDQARKRDIDWDGMRDHAGQEAATTINRVLALIGGLPAAERWDTIRDRYAGNINAARSAYRTQPIVERLDKEPDLFVLGCYIEAYHLDRADPRSGYIEQAKTRAGMPFAVLDADGWHERGHMGWWGAVHNETDDWDAVAARVIDAAPAEALFSLYDLHI